ncbi:MAG: hypothetical protein FWG58_04840 [Methanomassiliicoccaceae archaeon]|nr:hypothetical protein [Methanomassiliicoccaceae archaeon]
MDGRPKNVFIASILALLGALTALAGLVIYMDIGTDDFIVKTALYLLLLILFLAVAGSLSKDGQWSWRFLIFMEVLCGVFPVVAYVLEKVPIFIAAVLVALACLMILFTVSGKARRWVEIDRV